MVFAIRVSAVAEEMKEQAGALGELLALVIGGGVMLAAVLIGIVFLVSGFRGLLK